MFSALLQQRFATVVDATHPIVHSSTAEMLPLVNEDDYCRLRAVALGISSYWQYSSCSSYTSAEHALNDLDNHCVRHTAWQIGHQIIEQR